MIAHSTTAGYMTSLGPRLASIVTRRSFPLVGGASGNETSFYSESLCPDCLNFANVPLVDAMKEACNDVLEYTSWVVNSRLAIFLC